MSEDTVAREFNCRQCDVLVEEKSQLATPSKSSDVFIRSNTRIVGYYFTWRVVYLHTLCVCVALCRQTHCDGPIPRPGSPTKHLYISIIHKLRKRDTLGVGGEGHGLQRLVDS